jgi:hypothetical protein
MYIKNSMCVLCVIYGIVFFAKVYAAMRLKKCYMNALHVDVCIYQIISRLLSLKVPAVSISLFPYIHVEYDRSVQGDASEVHICVSSSCMCDCVWSLNVYVCSSYIPLSSLSLST